MYSLLTKTYVRSSAALNTRKFQHGMRNVAHRNISFSPLKFVPQGWQHWPKREYSNETKGEDKKEPQQEQKQEEKQQQEQQGQQQQKGEDKETPPFRGNKYSGYGWGSNNSKSSNKDNKNDKKWSNEDLLLWGATGLSISIAVALELELLLSDKKLDWETFVSKYLIEGKVAKLVVVNKEIVKVYLKNEIDGSGVPKRSFEFRIGSVEDFENKMETIQKQIGMKNIDKVGIVYHDESNLIKDISKIVPTVLLAIIGIRMLLKNFNPGKGKGGLFNIGKSNAKLFNKQDKVGVGFKDVAGMPEAKQEIQEFVDFLKNPKKYEELGARIPKGALLVGPPGTGKTLLAKATAGEASVPFLSTSGSDFIEMFVGVGPARVRDLFETARDNSPCIIFIDEIDAIGRARGRGGYFGGNDERENTLNQILVEMDGFISSSGVVVLAGTNRPDILDKALLRPGRFDRQIAIDKPDVNARIEIFQVHLKPLKLDNVSNIEEYAKKMAKLTPGFSGADIANACNEAALIAARRNATEITMQDLENAIDRVIAGLEKKSKVLSQKEKKTVAYHEAGHALLGWFLEHADPVLKVSIVPRGSSALGYTQYLPSDQFIIRKEKLDDMMCMALGGRVAEEIVFGSITTGAQDDLDRVAQIAYSQVKLYGMNDKVGPFSFPQEEGGLRPYSEETATLMDEEVRLLVQTAHTRARQLMIQHKEGLEKLAAVLLEKEVIGFDDLAVVFGPRPWKTATSTA